MATVATSVPSARRGVATARRQPWNLTCGQPALSVSRANFVVTTSGLAGCSRRVPREHETVVTRLYAGRPRPLVGAGAVLVKDRQGDVVDREPPGGMGLGR